MQHAHYLKVSREPNLYQNLKKVAQNLINNHCFSQKCTI